MTHIKDLSPAQADGVAKIKTWLSTPKRDRPQEFRLFGYAGTGKTTAITTAAAEADLNMAYIAFTGKAASVMRRNGLNAQTLHSLIYQRIDDCTLTGQPRFERVKREYVERLDLIVLDECSMIGDLVADDLLSFGVPVLAIGDPAQLPPVNDGAGLGYFTRGKPDVMLTEIHRQAADNPILKLATKARSGRAIPYGRHGESEVLLSMDLFDEDLWYADQVIVGTNATRTRLNKRARAHFGMVDPTPMFGDKVICTRNSPKYGIFNGEMFTVIRCDVESSAWLSLSVVRLDDPENKVIPDIRVHRTMFVPDGKKRDASTMGNSAHFDFGYAITAHKAQGSQWDKLIIIDESSVFREMKDKWLYTAITRAAHTVKIGRGRI